VRFCERVKGTIFLDKTALALLVSLLFVVVRCLLVNRIIDSVHLQSGKICTGCVDQLSVDRAVLCGALCSAVKGATALPMETQADVVPDQNESFMLCPINYVHACSFAVAKPVSESVVCCYSQQK